MIVNKKTFTELKILTQKAPFGSLKNNQFNSKIKYINNLLLTYYNKISLEKSIIFIPKTIDYRTKTIVVSSHIDTAYEINKIKQSSKKIIGTLDNSITNQVVVDLLKYKFYNTIFAFTDFEEKDMSGVIELSNYINNKTNDVIFLALDVTPYYSKDICLTIENAKFLSNAGLTKISHTLKNFKFYSYEKCFNDEGRSLCELGNIALSLCLPIKMYTCLLHSSRGMYVLKKNFVQYKKQIARILKRL